MFNIGDQICWTGDFTDPQSIQRGTVTKTQPPGAMALLWVDHYHKAEDCIYQAWCWPLKANDELLAVVTERQRLKKAFDDSMGLVYELRNRVARGEFK